MLLVPKDPAHGNTDGVGCAKQPDLSPRTAVKIPAIKNYVFNLRFCLLGVRNKHANHSQGSDSILSLMTRSPVPALLLHSSVP